MKTLWTLVIHYYFRSRQWWTEQLEISPHNGLWGCVEARVWNKDAREKTKYSLWMKGETAPHHTAKLRNHALREHAYYYTDTTTGESWLLDDLFSKNAKWNLEITKINRHFLMLIYKYVFFTSKSNILNIIFQNTKNYLEQKLWVE